MGGAAPTSSLDRASTVNALGDHHVLKAHDAEPSPVYSRDFAYANNEPVTLAHNHLMGSVQNHPEKSSGLHSSSVDKTSAKTFAEYVDFDILYHLVNTFTSHCLQYPGVWRMFSGL